MPKRLLLLLSLVTLVGVAGSDVPVPSTWKTPKFPQWGFFLWGIEAEATGVGPSEAVPEPEPAGIYPFAKVTAPPQAGGSLVDVTFIRGSNFKEKEAVGRLDVTGECLVRTTPADFGNWSVRVRNGRSQYRRIEWANGKWSNAIFLSGTSIDF